MLARDTPPTQSPQPRLDSSTIATTIIVATTATPATIATSRKDSHALPLNLDHHDYHHQIRPSTTTTTIIVNTTTMATTRRRTRKLYHPRTIRHNLDYQPPSQPLPHQPPPPPAPLAPTYRNHSRRRSSRFISNCWNTDTDERWNFAQALERVTGLMRAFPVKHPPRDIGLSLKEKKLEHPGSDA